MKCILPGTFDPITLGHVDVIERAARLFDEVRVVFMINANKKFMFDLDDRVAMARRATAHISNATVDRHDGLLYDYCRQNSINTVIRGLRNSSDFDYEMLYFTANRSLNPELEMLFIPTAVKYLHISSSLIREIISYGGDISSFVPDCNIEEIWKLYGNTSTKG